MNIHIITVYDSMNYGSYFQGLALTKELEKYGSVDFVDIHHQNIYIQTIIRVSKDAIRLRKTSALLEVQRLIKFVKAQRLFKIIKYDNVGKDDILIFGSDEIWNISRKKIRKSKEFFGYGFANSNKFSLATSINNTTYKELCTYDYVKQELLKFRAISVRDGYTKRCIDRLLNQSSILVADPTLMFTKKFYDQYKEAIKDEKYIVVYTYGKMLNNHTVEKIKKFANGHGLKTIAIGNWYKFCDKSLVPTPGQFLSYISKADYIFTDTFHGTLFSIIYEKQFVSFPCGNTKVEETLDLLNLKERICVDNTRVEDIIKKNIDYKVISKNAYNFGEKTREFIREILDESKGAK